MSDLRDRVLSLFRLACDAADPATALSRALQDQPLPRPAPGGRLVLLAIGKAAVPMMETALAHLPTAPDLALVVTNYENARPVAGAVVHAAGHPVPDAKGEAAARAVETAVSGLTADDRVVALISGGGSALLPAPAPGITLADKAMVSRLLLRSGFDIAEMNLVRQALSRLKGGGLLRAAMPAKVTGFILSDVIGDDLRIVASGLTVGPVGGRDMACNLLIRRGLWDALPDAVRQCLTDQPPLPPLPPAQNILIGSNRKSLDAVLQAAGAGGEIRSDHLTGDVGDAARRIVADAVQAADRTCLIYGGETTVTLRGSGLGGRNQELALRVAMAMPDLGRPWLFLSGGTDGRDGPTDAAGGIVDGGTVARILAAGGDPAALLANNDSHAALGLAGDLLITGATGTNVADVQILLLGPKAG